MQSIPKQFKVGEVVALNGESYRIVHIWKSGKVTLHNRVQGGTLILTMAYLREHCEY